MIPHVLPDSGVRHPCPRPSPGGGRECARRTGWTRTALVALSVAAAGCAATPPAVPDARHAVVERIVASTVKVILEDDGRRVGVGSGVVVAAGAEGPAQAPVSYVLTSAHLVEGKEAAPISVLFTDRGVTGKKRFPATIVHVGNSETLDLAVLRIPGIAAPQVALAGPEEARLGEEILVVGFPWGRRLGLFSGIVSQIPLPEEEGDGARGEGGEQGIMVDAVAVSGVSGGGVFRTSTGTLLGVVEGYRTASIAVKSQSRSYSVRVPVPGETFVVPTARIRSFLRAAGIRTGASGWGYAEEGKE